jgi:glycosyltransferase involved in cell wall biosynthesis
MVVTTAESRYLQSDRPAVALITNHGYAGVEIPFGGAPDTGGQNQYVNSLARALETLGYRVTIFARGGFPHFDSDRIRGEPELLSDHVRYVFVPGGGNEFLRKEDIAVALDEEIDWLDAFIRDEAATKNCLPWEVYELVNTHYWDAAILGGRLVERWRNDIAAEAVDNLLRSAVPDGALKQLRDDRHWNAVGDAAAFYLGQLLIQYTASPSTPLIQRVRQAAERLAKARDLNSETVIAALAEPAERAIEQAGERTAPVLQAMLAADAVGHAVLRLLEPEEKALQRRLAAVDRHVWTPHSLGSLKDQNFRDQPVEVRRTLKFCERRSHERTVCARTRMFVATSEEIATQLGTHFGVPADRIFYYPPCVDPEVFRPYEPQELEATYRYLSELSGIATETLRSMRIVFETSRMDQTKRKDLLLDAFARVARARDDVLLLIGGGPQKELYQSLAAQRDAMPELAGRALLAGYIPDQHIGPLFSLADVYVSASEMEGFGMSALQAAASGTALIASDLTPFAVQYVPDCAIVVPAGQPEAFAEAMQRLLDDTHDRESRAAELLERVKTLQWESQTQKFLEFLGQAGIGLGTLR